MKEKIKLDWCIFDNNDKERWVVDYCYIENEENNL